MTRAAAALPLVLSLGACVRGTTPPAAPVPGAAAQAPRTAPPPPAGRYEAIVAAEAVDQVSLVSFGPEGGRVEWTMPVGIMLADPDGPHGVAVSPDGAHFYVSTAHGTPYGTLWKYDTGTRAYVGKVTLGNFPATAQVTPDGRHAVVVNFNLHGEMEPSDVSIVRTDSMLEVARLATCTMPHGSRLTADGTRHYSACMMDDLLVEIDVPGLQVSRHFVLTRGQEHGMPGAPVAAGGHAGHDMGGHGLTPPPAGSARCSPTWAQPTPDGRTVWVACNGTSELVEVDATMWAVRRRLPAGEGVYNLAITRDGRRLVTTNKRGQSVSVVDTESGRTLATLPTQRRVVHGAAITDDDRYAFVTVEGVGSEPGTVEVIDLVALATVARVDVGQMAGGVDVVVRREGAARPE